MSLFSILPKDLSQLSFDEKSKLFSANFDLIIDNFRILFIDFLVKHSIVNTSKDAENLLDEIYEKGHFIGGSTIILCIFEYLHPELAKKFENFDLDIYSFKTNKKSIDFRKYDYEYSSSTDNGKYVGTYLKKIYEKKNQCFFIEYVKIYDDVYEEVTEIFNKMCLKDLKQFFFIPNKIKIDKTKPILDNGFSYICTYSDSSISKNIFDGKTLLVHDKKALIDAKSRITVNEQSYHYITKYNKILLRENINFERLKYNEISNDIYIIFKNGCVNIECGDRKINFMGERVLWQRLGERLIKYNDRGIKFYNDKNSIQTIIKICNNTNYGMQLETDSVSVNEIDNNVFHEFIQICLEKKLELSTDIFSLIYFYYIDETIKDDTLDKKNLRNKESTQDILKKIERDEEEKKKMLRESLKKEKEIKFQNRNLPTSKQIDTFNRFGFLDEDSE